MDDKKLITVDDVKTISEEFEKEIKPIEVKVEAFEVQLNDIIGISEVLEEYI